MASIFSKIIARDLPGNLVYETDSELAFLDINPSTVGHTLVVPKREVAAFHELPEAEAASLAAAVQVVAKGVIRAMDTPHYNLALNNGAPAGQVVFHVHFHVIPRYEGQPRVRHGAYGPGEAAQVAEKIREALQGLGYSTPE